MEGKKIAIFSFSLFLDIAVAGGDSRLTLQTDESYKLNVTTSGRVTTARINANSFFGARHALETLLQLVEYEENEDALLMVSEAYVEDTPAFPYRGILLDTSRNFFSVESIKRTLDGMASNKLNTFHWHITDSHSFPLELATLPLMTYYGAYTSRSIYSANDVREVGKTNNGGKR